MATLDTVATRSANTNSIPDGKAYFETNTYKFIVWDATDGEWVEFHRDGTGALKTINLAEDNDIDPGTEQAIAAITGRNIGTYALNSEGSAFYVYDGTNWQIFKPYN